MLIFAFTLLTSTLNPIGSISPDPFRLVFENFDAKKFTETVLGSQYEQISKQDQRAFESLLLKRLRNRFQNLKWKQTSPWKRTARGLKANFEKRQKAVSVELIRLKSNGKFVDLIIERSSILINSAASMQRELKERSPAEILQRLKSES